MAEAVVAARLEKDRYIVLFPYHVTSKTKTETQTSSKNKTTKTKQKHNKNNPHKNKQQKTTSPKSSDVKGTSYVKKVW